MERPRPAILLAAALLLILAAYSNALEVGYVWDDHVLIEENPQVRQPQAPLAYFSSDFWAVPLQRGQLVNLYYRPVVALSFALDWAWGGGAPLAFHLTNLLAHLLVAALVFRVARQLGASGLAAAVGCLAFGLAPRLTESVTWIVGRTDVLATLFVLSALSVELAQPGRLPRRLAVALLLLLGLLCKEVALAGVGAAALLGVLRVIRGQTRLGEEAIASLPFVAALTAWALCRNAGLGHQAGVRTQSLGAMAESLGHFALMLLTPWVPNAQVGYAGEVHAWAVALALLLVAAVGAAAWFTFRLGRLAELTLAVGAFFALALVSAAALGGSTVAADRFLYLPLALGGIVLATALEGLSAWKVALAAVLASSFGPATWARNHTWASELRFWERTVAQADARNAGPALGLGDALLARHRLVEALAQYRRAEALQPSESGQLSVAVTLSRLGREQEALSMLTALLAAHPSWKRAAWDLAQFRARALDFDGAQQALSEAEQRLGGDPVLTELRAALGEAAAALASLGPEQDDEPAATRLERARRFDGLGATGKARPLYSRVAAQAQAPREARVKALSWLVIQGEPAEAQQALAALGSLQPEVGTLAGLRAILDERLGR